MSCTCCCTTDFLSTPFIVHIVHARPVPVERVVNDLKDFAEGHHRSKDTAKTILDIAIPILCKVILEQPTAVADTRVEHTLNSYLTDSMVFFVITNSHMQILRLKIFSLEASKSKQNTLLLRYGCRRMVVGGGLAGMELKP